MNFSLLTIASLIALACGAVLSAFFIIWFVRQEHIRYPKGRGNRYFVYAFMDIMLIIAVSGVAYALPSTLLICLGSTSDMLLRFAFIALAWCGGAASCCAIYGICWQRFEKALRKAWQESLSNRAQFAMASRSRH